MGAYILYAIFFFIAIIMALTVWNDWKERRLRNMEFEQRKAMISLQKESVDPNTPSSKTVGTRDLFLETLTKIGCQYQIGEGEDNRIYFAYQGENFFANATNDCAYVHVYDTNWEHVELYDIDELSRMKRAINTANLNAPVTTIYTIDEDGQNMDVHSRMSFPFIHQMPNLEDYLRVELNSFFRAHQLVGTEMMKLREKED